MGENGGQRDAGEIGAATIATPQRIAGGVVRAGDAGGGGCVVSGRIRSLKPELLEDAKTAGLSDSAFRLFIGMILLSDDVGRLRGDTRYLCGQVFWASPEGSTRTREEVARAREELASDDVNLIEVYTVREQEYVFIRGFQKHQRIDKPSKPKCPGPDEATGQKSPREGSTRARKKVARAPGGIGSGVEGKGDEGNGTEGKEPEGSAPIVSIPDPSTDARRVYDAIVADDYIRPITADPASFARRVTDPDYAPGVNVVAEILTALEWREGKGKQYTDGRAFLRNWIDRERKKVAAQPKPAAASPPKAPDPEPESASLEENLATKAKIAEMAAEAARKRAAERAQMDFGDG